MRTPKNEKKYKLSIGILIIIILSLAWYLKPYTPMDEVEYIFEKTGEVNIEENNWLIFKPEGIETNTGFIFYPGARVQSEAYALLAYDIAELGYKVVIVSMPLNLAIFGVNEAARVMNECNEITDWVIGGHSLGGAMAARYAYHNIQKLSGLILLASYPAQNNDLSDKEINVLSIYSSNDGITSLDKINDSRDNLPDDTGWVEINGGNHSQFGWYGFQRGDNKAQISREKQQSIIVNSIKKFMSRACQN